MNKGYGNFFSDVAIAIECEYYRRQVEKGSELANRKLNRIIDPISVESIELEETLEENKKDVYSTMGEALGMANLKFKYKNIRNLLYIIEPSGDEKYEASKCNVKIAECCLEEGITTENKLKVLAYLKLAYKYKFKNDYDFMNKMITSRFAIPIVESDTPADLESFIFNYNLLQFVLRALEGLTPRQLLGVFPLEKEYNGHRWGAKDYYSSIKAIEEHGIDAPFTHESATEFIMDVQMGSFMFNTATSLMGLVSDFNKWDASDIMGFLEDIRKPKLEIVKDK